MTSPGPAQGCLDSNRMVYQRPWSQNNQPEASPEGYTHWTSCLTADQITTAPLSAVPAKASGTLNPLCKVLCILQSLYLCAIGSMSVLFLAKDTPRSSNCSPKQLYSWMQAAKPRQATHTAPYRTVSLCRCPFQGHSWCMACQDSPQAPSTHSIC